VASTATKTTGFRLGIDIGGSFTDYVLYDSSTGRLATTKSLSQGKDLASSFTQALLDLGVEPDTLNLLIHGTTVVTNLILERDGARVGLITTEGFRDVLEIGWSFRSDPWDLQWTKPVPIVPRPLRLEVHERVSSSGEVVEPLEGDDVRRALRRLLAAGVDAVAVAFLNSYANPVHEEEARRIVADQAPDLPCVVSSEVDPQLGEYERLSTTVLSAYARPRLGEYVDAIERWIGAGKDAYFMQSEGGIIPAPLVRANPTALVLSGPAAGVLATCHVGALAGQQDLISLDVGGTSADVCLIRDGRPGLREVLEVEPGMPLRSPSIDVVSVGAGGGSIAWIDQGGALRVGPRSAGAHPGPACYGAGGTEPTLTDANVVLGITNARGLLGGRLEGDPAAAQRAVENLAVALGISMEDAALGVYRIANASMAQAIRTLTVQRGIDPRDFTLVPFGGAGGQHAIDVAREMQIPAVLFPPQPSTFSAFGLLTADVQTTRTFAVVDLLEEVDALALEDRFTELEANVLGSFPTVAGTNGGFAFSRFADLRYLGQVHAIRVGVSGWEPEAINEVFENSHEVRYGTRLGDPVEVVNVGVIARLVLEKPTPTGRVADGAGLGVTRRSFVLLENDEIPVIARLSIEPQTALPSPCLVEEVDSVIYLPSGTHAVSDRYGNIVCEVGPERKGVTA
jgi:N-methylhydantoinase A